MPNTILLISRDENLQNSRALVLEAVATGQLTTIGDFFEGVASHGLRRLQTVTIARRYARPGTECCFDYDCAHL
jgi:hypothetical protein